MAGWELPAILLVGAAIGVLGAMVGIGGGTLMVPFLALVLGVPIHSAIGASVVAVIATSCAAAGVYLGNRLTNLRLGITLETSTTVGGILGGLIAVSLDRRTLMLAFAAALSLVAIAMTRRREYPWREEEVEEGQLGGHFYDPSLGRQVRYRARRAPMGLAAGLLAGVLSGMFGIGGGVVKVPAMVLGMDVPMKVAAATSNFMIGVTAVAGAFIYYGSGYVDVLIATPVAVGVFVGSLLGARWTPHLHSALLARVFSATLLTAALLMGLRAVGVY